MLTPNEKYGIVKAIICVIIMIVVLIDPPFAPLDRADFELSYGERKGTYFGSVNNEGKPEGYGKLVLINKAGIEYWYSGDFVDGHFEGVGTTTWDYNGFLKEKGTYKNDEIVPIKLEEEKTDLIWNTEEYLYHCIEFTGVVEDEPEYAEEFTGFNVIWDIGNNDDALTVNIYDHDFEVEPGDYVRVMGIVERCYTELNDAGEEKTVPVIAAYEYDVISYEEAISPELFEKDPDKKYLRPVWYTK